jgi:hypothetical protein
VHCHMFRREYGSTVGAWLFLDFVGDSAPLIVTLEALSENGVLVQPERSETISVRMALRWAVRPATSSSRPLAHPFIPHIRSYGARKSWRADSILVAIIAIGLDPMSR